MKGKKTLISFMIGGIVITLIVGLRLLYLGQPLSEVLKSTIMLLVFLMIPIFAALRSLKKQEVEKPLEPTKRERLAVAFWVLAPFLAGLIYLLFPSSVAMPLAVAIIAVAMLLFHLEVFR